MYIHHFIVYKVVLTSASNYLAKMCFQRKTFELIWLILLMYYLINLGFNILRILDK